MSRLEIFLYPGCRFTKNYNERCSFETPTGSNYSVLELYLNSLDYERFELENIYYENNMEIVIEREYLKDPYIYNYMKIIEYDGDDHKVLTRYCFVNKIECKNGLAYIDFEEDIWNSYAPVIWGSAPCLLTASRFKNTDYFSFETLELPIEYDGNNAFHIDTVPNVYTGKVVIIAEIQAYDLTQQGGRGNRFTGYYAFAQRNENAVHNKNWAIPEDAFETTMDNAYESIEYLLLNMSGGQMTFNTNQWYYEIGNIFIVPYAFFVENIVKINEFTGDSYGYGYAYNNFIPTNRNLVGKVLCRLEPTKYNLLNETFTATIVNNYKNFSIGTFTNQVKCHNNGTDKDIKIIISFAQSSFAIKMTLDNQFYDITNDFKFEIPYEPLRSEVIQQGKIALALQNNNLNYGIFKAGTGIAENINQTIGGVGKAIASGYAGNYAGMIGGIEQAVSANIGIVNNIYTINKLNKDKSLINSPQYTSNKGLFNNVNYFLNFTYGLILCSIVPDNEYYVKNAVDNLGFKVAKFISYAYQLQGVINGGYLFAVRENAYYNVIKFDGISVFGDFTMEIAQQLNAILESGIKIWYEPNFIPLDNYTDDLVS